MTRCPYCNERMTIDERSYDTVMAGEYCPNGCVRCTGCKERAVPGHDACNQHEIEGLLDELAGEKLGTPEFQCVFDKIIAVRQLEMQ